MRDSVIRYLIAAIGVIAVLHGSAIAGEVIRCSGTGTSIGGMTSLAAEFEKKHPGTRIHLFPSMGSTGGIRATKDGKLDVGFSARPLKDVEKAPGLIEEPYAETAVVFGTRLSNPAEGFRLSEIEEIYNARRTTWADGSPIRLALRPHSDSYTDFLKHIESGMKTAVEASYNVPGVFIGTTDRDAARYIERTPGAFGVTTYAVVTSEKRKIKMLAVDGVTPTMESISSGKYPYRITLYLVYRKESYTGRTKEFVDFVFSREAQQILLKNGFFPLKRSRQRMG